MTTLTKKSLAATPGTPGIPGWPAHMEGGTPPTSPKPAYCITENVYYPQTYGTIWIEKDGVLYPVAYSTGPQWVLEEHCYPATPGSPGTPGYLVPENPGIPPIPPSPTDYCAGWNSSARSVASLTGSGQYRFSVPVGSVGVITGLNDSNNGSAYQEIDYAIYCASTGYQIMEGGLTVGVSGNFSSGDVFTISRVGTEVRYFKNTTLLYTSTVPSTGTVFVDSSLYFGGDKIIDATLLTSTDTGFVPALSGTTGSLSGPLGGLRSYITNIAGAGGGIRNDVLQGMNGSFTYNASLDGVIAAELGQMQCFIAEVDVAQVRIVFSNLTGTWTAEGGIQALLGVFDSMRSEFNSSDISAVCEGTLGGMTSYLESGLLAPQFAVANEYLQTMTSFMIALAGMSGVLTGVLGGMRGFASNAPPGGYLQPGYPPPVISGSSPPQYDIDSNGDWEGRSNDQLRMLTGFFIDSVSFDAGYEITHGQAVLPSLVVHGSILRVTSAIGDVRLPTPPLTVHADCGWQVAPTLPALQADVRMTIMNVVRTEFSLPLPMLTAQGTGTVGTIFGTPAGYPIPLPRLTVNGHVSIGWQGKIILPYLVVAGRITTDPMMRVGITLPLLDVAGSIRDPYAVDPANPSGRFLQGHAVLPALLGDLNRLEGDLRLPRLRGGGRIPTLAPTGPVEGRIAYAMNLKTGAVTEFTNFPFLAMGRAYNVYWSVGLDGNLYRMEGDTDDTLPIDWEWMSGLNDFAVWGQKGVMAAYIRGVFENGATMTVQTDEAVRVYDHVAAGDYKNHKVHRIPLGRGVRTDSMAFGMANPKGGYLELDKVTPEYIIIPRNL